MSERARDVLSFFLSVTLFLGALLAVSDTLRAQPNTAPDWKYGSAAGDVQRRIEYDKDGDHINVNLRSDGAQTISAADRCKIATDAESVIASCDGGAYVVLGGGVAGCACGGTGVQSTCVGPSCSASGSAATAVGFGSIAADSADTCVGHDSACSGPSATGAGQGLTCTGNEATCIGAGSSGTVTGATCVGFDCDATGTNATGVGRVATVTGANAVCVGASSSCLDPDGIGIGFAAAPSTGVCIGRACDSTTNNLVVGSVDQTIDTVVFGNGRTSLTPSAVLLSTTNAAGTNTNGADFSIRAGVSTGVGTTGDLHLIACPAGAPGSSPNTGTCFAAWSIDGETGNLNPATLIDIGNTQAVRHIAAAELSLTGVAGAGKVVCVKANGDLGVCADAPDVTGVCTCG